MQAYHVQAKVAKGGNLTIDGIPFQDGEVVEVIVLESSKKQKEQKKKYPLWGTPIKYERPTDPVAEEDWAVLQ